MTEKARMAYYQVAPDAIKALTGVESYIAHSGLEKSLIELVKMRVSGRALSAERLDFKALRTAAPAGAATAAWRRVHFLRGQAPSVVEVVPRSALASEPRRGPLIIEEFDATILVPAHAAVHLDAIGNIVLDLS